MPDTYRIEVDTHGWQFFHGDFMCAVGRQMSFMQDGRLGDIIKREAHDNMELEWAWRLHTLTWAAVHAGGLPGDFVECGVFRGFMSRVIVEYIWFEEADKTFYLFDSFDGLSDDWSSKTERDGVNDIYENEKTHGYTVEEVRNRFARWPNVRVIKGVIPSVLMQAPEKISYLHIDLNAEKAEIATLDALFDRVVPGGVIIFDDFGRAWNNEMCNAEQLWLAKRNYFPMELPTGQGLVIKL